MWCRYKKDYNEALVYFEKGIGVDPAYPSNYYWASKIFCSGTDEEVWGMIYGEIFMNLERGSKRTAEISQLLYNTYKEEVKFTSDTSMSVSFSKNATITLDELKDPKSFRLPFGIGLYEPTLMIALVGEKGIDLTSLSRIRTRFIDEYYRNGKNKDYPNSLFEYQKIVKDAGHIEAYNHWILMKGEEEKFNAWKAMNNDKWNSFIGWFSENPLVFNQYNRFHRLQY